MYKTLLSESTVVSPIPQVACPSIKLEHGI